MNRLRQHRLALALLISILFHLVAIGAPGWRVPTLDDLLPAKSSVGEVSRLDAHLAPPPVERARLAVSGRAAAERSARAPVRPSSGPPAASGVLALPAVQPDADAGEVAGDAMTGDAANAPVGAAQPGLTAPPQPVSSPLAAAAPGAATEASRAVPAQTPAELLLPRRGSVRFALSRGDQGFVVGQSTHHWNHDGKTYVLNSVTETTGLVALFKSVRVVWLSQGEMRSDGLLPHEFRTEKDGVRGDAASFDWGAMKLGLTGGPQREVRLQPGAQDVLSMFYQLSTMLPALIRDAGEAGEGGEKQGGFSLYVTTGRKLERYRFGVLGEERLALRHRGSQRTLHLRTPAGDQTIDIWLGIDLHGLPLKIRYTDGKGDSFDQKAEDIEFEGMTGSPGSH